MREITAKRRIMEKKRFLSPEDMQLLLNLTISSESFWDVLVSTGDERFLEEVRGMFLDDDRVRIQTVDSGCDALISCVRKVPDLLVFDSGLTDISPAGFFSSLRRDPVLGSIPILCRVKEYPQTGDLDWGADDYICEDMDVDKIYLSRKMHTLLYSNSLHDVSGQKDIHERQWPRTKVNITARISISQPENPEHTECGQAAVENISLGGAYLSEIKLENGVLPQGSFTITLHIDQPALRNWNADSSIVHMDSEGAAGVRFVNISKVDRLKIAELFLK